ncbi:dipeptide epimerase [Bradyrhizobium liaoningense]|uniref:dipeptide epimerase n=1 Tax=Bradyrhizobium liaoningense TaxID=43992 RepID=UPI0009DA7046|nr:dipeptide epimerase [Bradyrhizobium liaoningense]
MQLEFKIVTLRRREPLVSQKGSLSEVRQLFLRLTWEGKLGHGASVLGRGAGTRGAEDLVASALAGCQAALHGATPFEFEAVLDLCEPVLADHPSALAAMDIALHDLLGQAARLPLHCLWGLHGHVLPPTAISISITDEATRVRRACELAAWPILKLKLAADDNLQVVARIREVYRGRLWVDANGGWTPDRAIVAAHYLKDLDVELLEQPVPPGCLVALAAVHRASPIPVVADEDCIGPADVLRLRHCTDTINIKLFKCGGLRRAREVALLARRVGLRVMVGSKVESVLGVTAIAHLAGLADYADLDGHLDLVNDPYAGIVIDHGNITLPHDPGLGVILSAPLSIGSPYDANYTA